MDEKLLREIPGIGVEDWQQTPASGDDSVVVMDKKDRLSLTSREILCRKVLFNLSIGLV